MAKSKKSLAPTPPPKDIAEKLQELRDLHLERKAVEDEAAPILKEYQTRREALEADCAKAMGAFTDRIASIQRNIDAASAELAEPLRLAAPPRGALFEVDGLQARVAKTKAYMGVDDFNRVMALPYLAPFCALVGPDDLGKSIDQLLGEAVMQLHTEGALTAEQVNQMLTQKIPRAARVTLTPDEPEEEEENS